MFCEKCGAGIDDNSSFCPSCGATVVSRYQESTINNNDMAIRLAMRKSVGACLILGIIIPGAGQMYAGKVLRGVFILIAAMVIGSMMVIALLPAYVNGGTVDLNSYLTVVSVASIAITILWIWSLFDAYKLVEKYNDEVMLKGRPPW